MDWNNKEQVLAAVHQRGDALRYASEELRKELSASNLGTKETNQQPASNNIIYPKGSHQFTSIPESVQHELRELVESLRIAHEWMAETGSNAEAGSELWHKHCEDLVRIGDILAKHGDAK